MLSDIGHTHDHLPISLTITHPQPHVTQFPRNDMDVAMAEARMVMTGALDMLFERTGAG